jgi:hypothetical protein
MSSFNLKIAQESFNSLVQQSIVFNVKSGIKNICSGQIQYNKLFLAENYFVDETIPLYQSTVKDTGVTKKEEKKSGAKGKKG